MEYGFVGPRREAGDQEVTGSKQDLRAVKLRHNHRRNTYYQKRREQVLGGRPYKYKYTYVRLVIENYPQK